MQTSVLLLLLMSLAELLLFVLIWRFFARLKRSEQLLSQLQSGQDQLLGKLELNAQLERDLMESFGHRQVELQNLDVQLEERAQALRKLLEQAEGLTRSPQFLRELIISGSKKGRSPLQLAKATGLSLDEVELILAQAEL